MEAIDEGFSCISLSLNEKIYLFLEKDSGIKKKYVPERLEESSADIRVMLGCGVTSLEILFMKQFYKKNCNHVQVGRPVLLYTRFNFLELRRAFEACYEDTRKIGVIEV